MQNNDIETRLKAAAEAERIFFTEGFTTPGGRLLEESMETIQKLHAQLADVEKRATEAEAVTDTFCRLNDEVLKHAKIMRSPELEKLVNDAIAEAETHYDFKCKKAEKIELEVVSISRKERIADARRKFVSDEKMSQEAAFKSYNTSRGLFYYVLERHDLEGAEVWTRKLRTSARSVDYADFAGFFTSVQEAEDYCKSQASDVIKSRYQVAVNSEDVPAPAKLNVSDFYQSLVVIDYCIQSADETPISDAVLKLTDALRQFAVPVRDGEAS